MAVGDAVPPPPDFVVVTVRSRTIERHGVTAMSLAARAPGVFAFRAPASDVDDAHLARRIAVAGSEIGRRRSVKRGDL